MQLILNILLFLHKTYGVVYSVYNKFKTYQLMLLSHHFDVILIKEKFNFN